MLSDHTSRSVVGQLALAAVFVGFGPAAAAAKEIHLQSSFPPLLFEDAPVGGAHPIGGLAYHFVEIANELLAHLGTTIVFHAPGAIHPADQGAAVEPPLVELGRDFATLHAAVAAGEIGGGVNIGIGLANQNGSSFGELYVAGLPFGMEADEFAGYLYGGGGLELQQELYDELFDRDVVVLPIALTATQGGGWFPEPLPDPDQRPELTDETAMAELCRKPWIVRWPEPGARIWQTACEQVGEPAGFIGAATRCADSSRRCPAPDNTLTFETTRLTFGGFVPGVPPHIFLLNGNIDAYELNMPFTEVHMIKLVLGETDRPNADADLSPVISRAPYYYGQTWHQPLTYVELLINRSYWNALPEAERRIITAAARSATLANWANTLSKQGEGIDLLVDNGAIVLRWPEGLLRVLRAASETYLSRRANELEAAGDAAYRRVLDHMTDYLRRQQVFNDFGDLNQGRAGIPTSSPRSN